MLTVVYFGKFKYATGRIGNEVTISLHKENALARDADVTRSRIMAAAISHFSEYGFGQTGVRDVAALASASPALVVRYFGSKERLFRAALESAMIMEPVLGVERCHLGERIARLFAGAGNAANPLSMIILSAADPSARAISIEVLERRVIAPLAVYLGPPDAEARAARLNILWSGFLIARQLLPLSPLSGSRLPSMLRWLAEETQAIVDQGSDA